jgi:hypothetical protein
MRGRELLRLVALESKGMIYEKDRFPHGSKRQAKLGAQYCTMSDEYRVSNVVVTLRRRMKENARILAWYLVSCVHVMELSDAFLREQTRLPCVTVASNILN